MLQSKCNYKCLIHSSKCMGAAQLAESGLDAGVLVSFIPTAHITYNDAEV